jgi:hypothetical protein
MWSVILRISLNGDTGSKIRQKYAPILQARGFTQFGGNTGSWRIDGLTPSDASQTLTQILQILADPASCVTNVAPNAHMDHLWVYLESTAQPNQTDQAVLVSQMDTPS